MSEIEIERTQEGIEVFSTKNFTEQKDFNNQELLKNKHDFNNYEIVGEAEKKFESPLQRYQRLSFEVSSFLKEISTKEPKSLEEKKLTSTKSLNDTLRRIQNSLTISKNNIKGETLKGEHSVNLTNKVISEIGELQDPKTLNRLKRNTNTVTYEMYSKDLSEKELKKNASLSELGPRISQLEKIIGDNTDNNSYLNSSTQNKQSIYRRIMDLKRKIEILDSNKLGLLKKKTQDIIEKLDKEKNKTKIDQDTNTKFLEIYEKMKKYNKIVNEIPILISRLNILQQIHEEKISVIKHLYELESKQKELETNTSHQKPVLDILKQNLEENMKVIKSNMELLQKRVKKIQK
ncbi:dynactin subunit [Anaeramoeba flamelloides]|uniref:Dynactin subunit n=1 Tax=Anaeramoeba flamelloides TaxID=1746091 RepID=A0AAV7ZFI3_9EUKA|nr:dynactin subunit [Anaeramoeba flamelloides]